MAGDTAMNSAAKTAATRPKPSPSGSNNKTSSVPKTTGTTRRMNSLNPA